uniref:RGS domain-containing protein n=1 Tax=Schistosoma mansoni TaxID=6183 RepID=A0A3Q0KJ12_SCHMA
MTTKINRTVEYTNEFINPLPCKSTSSEVHLSPCENMPKENELRTKTLVPAQRTYNECIVYALGEWRCACLTTVLVTGIILVSSCGVKQLTIYMNSSQSDTYYPISYHKHEQSFRLLCQTSSLLIVNGLLFLVYLVYLIESWQSRNWIQTTWLIDTKMAYNLIHNTHKLIPSILWQIKCYHYAHNTPQYNHHQQNPKQRCTTLNENDLNKPTKYPFIQGDFDISTTEVNTQNDQYSMSFNKVPEMFSHSSGNTNINQMKCHRIITMNKICSFDLSKIDEIWDMSDNISELENFQLIELNLSTLFSFSDKKTYSEFQRQKQEFFTTYEKFDIYMETEQICTFTDFMKFPKQFLIIHKSSKPPMYLKGITYLIATLLLCSFPLRIFIYANKAKLHCKIHKIFGPKPKNETLYRSLKLIPFNNEGTNSNCLLNTFSTYTIPSLTVQKMSSNYGKSNHILNDTNENNKLPYNNEAVVLCNKHISENATYYTRNHNKKCNKYPSTISKDSYDSSQQKYDNKIDIYQSTTEDEDDDEELLSLDIRFDEYIKNKCIKKDKRSIGNNYSNYELDTVLRNSNLDVTSI